MGIEIEKDLKPTQCKCYKLDSELLCWRSKVIGALTDKQEETLCSFKDTQLATAELKKRINSFTEAIHEAQLKYKGEGITTWLGLISDELKKRGIEV